MLKLKSDKIYREEGVSVKSMKRPKFQEMIKDMKDGKISKIIVYKLDRLTRSIQDLETICKMIEQYKCSLESISEELNTELDRTQNEIQKNDLKIKVLNLQLNKLKNKISKKVN